MKVNNFNNLLSHACFGVTLSLVGIVALSSLVLSSSIVAADVITTTTVNITESCTLTGTTDTAHTATLLNGTYSGTDYTNGIGQTTLKAFCNDAGGFAIYAIGYTNEEYGNTTMHWSGAANASDSTNAINTGIYTSGTTVNSTWSMKLASVAGTYAATIANGTNNTENFTNWHEIPDEYTKVAYRDSGTDIEINGSGTGSSITVTYDSYISAGQPAGSYVGKVKYTLVHPSTATEPIIPVEPLSPSKCPAYTVCYAPNANDVEGDMSSLGAISGSPKAGRQTQTRHAQYSDSFINISSTTTSVFLIAPNFWRDGYGFVGWSTDYTSTNASTIYGPNDIINIDVNNDGIDISTNGLILYPVWLASSGNLQDWTGCSSLTPVTYNSTTGVLTASLSSITALTDTRDNNVYTVARLADGNCWMTENLRLNAENSRGADNIAKAQGYSSSSSYGNFIGLADSEDGKFENVTTANSLYSTDGSNNTINIGTGSYPSERIPRYNNNNNNNALTSSYNSSDYQDNHYSWYSYGNYYSWAAAMASTKPYSNYSGSGGTDLAGTSICPSGWKLPLGYLSTGVLADGKSDPDNRVGSFSYLSRMMGGSDQYGGIMKTWLTFPNNFVLAGNSGVGRGGSGYYWSSTVMSNSTHDGQGVGISNGSIFINMFSTKYSGRSVRCLTE